LKQISAVNAALLVLFLSACSCQPPAPVDSPETRMVRAASGDLYRMDFEQAELTELRVDMPTETAFQFQQDPEKAGSRYASFTIDQGHMVKSGTRCELVIISDEMCTIPEAYYSWSLRIPDDYPMEKRWQLFAQWHDQPDEENGYTWKTKPPTFPPISLRCVEQKVFLQINRHNEDRWLLGPKVPIEPGKWVHFFFHIKWSMEDDGFVEAWMDDTPLTPFNGKDYRVYVPTIYNTTGNYLKLGNYRHNAIEGVSTVHIDDIAVGTRVVERPLSRLAAKNPHERPDTSSGITSEHNILLARKPFSVELAKWPLNRAGAVSLTYDGAPAKPNEYKVREILEANGLKMEYEMVTAVIQSYKKDFELIKEKLIPRGYQFFGHGHEHINHDEAGYDKALESFTTCYNEMIKMGLKPVAYAYPYGFGLEADTQRALKDAGFLSGRLHAPADARHPFITPEDQLEPDNWFAIPSLVMQDLQFDHCTKCCNNNEELLEYLSEAERRRAWLIVGYHALGDTDTYGWYTLDEFRKDAEAIGRSDMFFGSMNDITLYMYERNHASLEIEALENNRYRFTLSDGLENQRFDYPLTLIIHWPKKHHSRFFEFRQNGRVITNGWCNAGTTQVQVRPDEQEFLLTLKDPESLVKPESHM